MDEPGPLLHHYRSNPEFLFQQECLELKPTKTADIERTAVFLNERTNISFIRFFDVYCGIIIKLSHYMSELVFMG